MGLFKRKENISQKEKTTKELIKDMIDNYQTPLTDEEKEERKEVYLRLTNSLEITGRLEAEKFDKGILTLASIFLGFTLTFVDKIVPLRTAWFTWLLFISWLSFFISIVSVLTGLLTNQKSISQIITEASNILHVRQFDYSKLGSNKLNKLAGMLNYISLFLFVFGAAIFILFVIINVLKLK